MHTHLTKKARNILIIILSWEYLWVIFTLSIIIVRSVNDGIWSDPLWEQSLIRPRISTLVIWRVAIVFSILYVLINAVGSFGLAKKKSWGRQLSMISMGLISLFGMSILISYIPIFFEDGYYNILTEVIVPVLVVAAIIASGVLSVIYLSRPEIKEFFNSKPVQAYHVS